MAEAAQQSNANNSQSNHNNNARNVISQTSCPHGTTRFAAYYRTPTDATNASASLKAESFLNHQRVFSNCNCTLT